MTLESKGDNEKSPNESDDDYQDDNDPTIEEINAALEKSQSTSHHSPLILKENKPRRHFTPRNKKTNVKKPS